VSSREDASALNRFYGSRREDTVKSQQDRLLTVQEYAYVTREHPLTIYRRIREGRQLGVFRVAPRAPSPRRARGERDSTVS
jgi:hypothetical protein